ncbi:hypothetical protein EJ994_14045 [Maribacter sp. MJ134]|uniref:hypothetical protein n=1 Tax=Maribacter sp. MJ134 TaxID=2496865 RepID=UPI000F820F10|nr:hypothetical protein [Maribacter sp. MJ134]AZQ59863.1 hypothetical protein EJ994_14045 [Maribacter sp. MJ134]
MIYSYNKISHKITGFHRHISYVFEKIFKLDLAIYDEEKLIHPDFKKIVRDSKKRLEEPLKKIVVVYYYLPSSAKIQLKDAFTVNNDIKCLTDNSKYLVPYEALHPAMADILKPFLTSLWDEYPLVKAMETDFGSVKSHYKDLISKSIYGGFICPFCGLEKFDPPEDKHREAYDHYLAKAKYPFISINFDLLFPTCHKCNSKEKKDLDVLYDNKGVKRRAYNPYDEKLTPDSLHISIIKEEPYEKSDLKTLLKRVKWHLEIRRNAKIDQELETWLDVYRLNAKYKFIIKQYETTWFEILEKRFKRALERHEDFETFKKEELKEAKYMITNSTGGILKYSYFKFLLESENIEKRLYQCVRKIS